jgi:HTH-type transcriptional regulator/antitoxin HigA
MGRQGRRGGSRTAPADSWYLKPDTCSVEVLRALMEANGLRQKDLAPIFGSESIVSEVLHKKRHLNKTHIERLSKRFHISPAVFF